MDGGTFTISNGGVFGSLMGTPIINPPQSAILGIHAINDRPVAINGKVMDCGLHHTFFLQMMETDSHCKTGQTREHCFLAMFHEDGQTREHCFLATFVEKINSPGVTMHLSLVFATHKTNKRFSFIPG